MARWHLKHAQPSAFDPVAGAGSIAARGIGAFHERAVRRLRAADRAALARGGNAVLHDWSEGIHNREEAVALVDALDLVISVQTTIPHLSGALNL